MPFYDKQGLSDAELNLIKNWIVSGAKDIFGNSPAAACRFPHFGDMQIFAVSSSAESFSLNTTFKNELNEPICLLIEKHVEKIKVGIPMFGLEDVCTPVHEMRFELQCFRDAARTMPLPELSQSMQVVGNMLEAEISVKQVIAGNPVFMQLKVSSADKTMEFIGTQQGISDYRWGVIVKP
jgi:hypothetical protein